MIIVLLAVLGLIFGSFVNAFVWRLHEQEHLKEQKRPSQKRLRELSIWRGRSICPNCNHELAAKDLVPVFSWLLLKGRCRYCHKPIARQYPLVEVLMAVIFVVSYVYWPLNLHGVGLFQFILWLFFAVNFLILAVYDIKWFLLPDKIVLPLVAVAFIEIAISGYWLHDWQALLYPLYGAGILFGVFYVLFQVSGGNWIGGGDVKLALVLGALAGSPLRALLLMFLASFYGTIVSVPLLVRTKQNLQMKVPFGPFLLLATITVVLFGTNLAHVYEKLLLR